MSVNPSNIPERKNKSRILRDKNARSRPALFLRILGSDENGYGQAAYFDLAFIAFLDFLLAVTALLLLLPALMILALVIRIESPGPILFKQKRVGQFGREFWFYKFRSMIVDAENMQAALHCCNQASGLLFKMHNDPRVTKFGRVIRKYSLDELPQLVNVLKGDMSIVGPRPALPVEAARYSTEQLRRLEIKPGITGLWQVSGRSDLSFERAIQLDIEYVERRSACLYVIILIRTIPAVIAGTGAY
jgi:lipopolysaccharide/colanic/teichoic acid biosynthesis glycosyltransferase